MRYYYTPIKMLKSETKTTGNAGERCRAKELSFIAGKNAKWWSLWKTIWQFLTKLNIVLLQDLAIRLPGIYSNEVKTYVYTKTYVWMFIATLFIITKT